MSYGWLTESTLFGKKEEIIELNKDKLFNENKGNDKNESSIDKLNGMVNSYLQNIKENKKNQIGRKKVSYHDKLYNAKNEGVDRRNKQDKKNSLVKTQINKVKKYEQLKKKGQNDPKCLVNFESKKEVEQELEEIQKLRQKKIGTQL
ncbi:conserved Plasmodium protein, unknown function [Plasmodium malariae]|uniref:Uncharacterized protein n=1 Tax=Plasmodium malariae TaxID=5858 RepID=A0A1A8W3A3_PLAMA|nr:conserved Plasmodium protein, unknown function [Plasmodium malariae]SBS87260.1 conserved Plasmodium protein, unknown function [Plasmodium malariae]SBT79756.1 conserved Plasmodium protein, unknown function [Plasmodium malariae]SCO93218.1 conserved Plasmodium protein, unknown function [Plasmodium malariae]